MTETPLPFHLRKIGHVVLNVSDLDAAVRFYTELLGFQVSDRYPDSMVPGGMVFLRCNTDHHGVALVGGAPRVPHSSLNHFAFEVGTLDEVFRARAWLRKQGVPIHFVTTHGDYMEIDTEEDYVLANRDWPRRFSSTP